MKTTKLTKTTRRIAGHEITLIEGVRYIATREMATRRMRVFTVTIQAAIGSPPDADNAVLPGLSYDAANAFLAEFNHGPSWHDGRIWARAETCEVCEDAAATCEEIVLGTTRSLCADCRAGGVEQGILGGADSAKGGA